MSIPFEVNGKTYSVSLITPAIERYINSGEINPAKPLGALRLAAKLFGDIPLHEMVALVTTAGGDAVKDVLDVVAAEYESRAACLNPANPAPESLSPAQEQA